MAIAAMIVITATTRSSSIRENPLLLRINSPQPGPFVRGHGRHGIRPTGVHSSGWAFRQRRDAIPNQVAKKVIFLRRAEPPRVQSSNRQKRRSFTPLRCGVDADEMIAARTPGAQA